MGSLLSYQLGIELQNLILHGKLSGELAFPCIWKNYLSCGAKVNWQHKFASESQLVLGDYQNILQFGPHIVFRENRFFAQIYPHWRYIEGEVQGRQKEHLAGGPEILIDLGYGI